MAKKLVAQDVLDYEAAVVALKEAKKLEGELRNKIIGAFRYTKTEGVEHKSVDGLDIDIAITLGMGRTIDVTMLEKVWEDLDAEQQAAIEYKPKLVGKAYKDLVASGDAGKLVKAIIEKPSQATVKLKFDES